MLEVCAPRSKCRLVDCVEGMPPRKVMSDSFAGAVAAPAEAVRECLTGRRAGRRGQRAMPWRRQARLSAARKELLESMHHDLIYAWTCALLIQAAHDQ